MILILPRDLLLPQRKHPTSPSNSSETLKADRNISASVKTRHPGEQLSRTIAHGTPSTSCLHRRMDDAPGGWGDLVYLRVHSQLCSGCWHPASPDAAGRGVNMFVEKVELLFSHFIPAGDSNLQPNDFQEPLPVESLLPFSRRFRKQKCCSTGGAVVCEPGHFHS